MKQTKPKRTRCGITPYTITPQKNVLFCFGVDIVSGDISDWGGGKNKNETVEQAASRELFEESNGLLDISPDILRRSYVTRISGAVTYFVEMEYNVIITLPPKFDRILGSKEMSGVRLVFLRDLLYCINQGLFYQVVANLLLKSKHIFLDIERCKIQYPL